MGKVPVLEDNQMQRLRQLVGSHKKLNLCPPSKAPNRRLPVDEDESPAVALRIIAVAEPATDGYGAAGGKPIVANVNGTYSIVQDGEAVGLITLYM